MSLVIYLPYDRGFPHRLSLGKEEAVLNEDAALRLNILYGIPMGNEGGRIIDMDIPVNLLGALADPKIKLSKRARRLVAKAQRSDHA